VYIGGSTIFSGAICKKDGQDANRSMLYSTTKYLHIPVWSASVGTE